MMQTVWKVFFYEVIRQIHYSVDEDGIFFLNLEANSSNSQYLCTMKVTM